MNIAVQNVQFKNVGFQKIKNLNENLRSKTEPAIHPQNNSLLDMNYGASLVKMNKLSFTGGKSTNVVPLSKKIATALHLMKQDDLIIVGKSLEEAKKALKASIGSVPNVFKKLLYIEHKGLEEAFAISKNSSGHESIINLKDSKIKLQNSNKILSFIEKGEAKAIQKRDSLLLGEDVVKLSKGSSDAKINKNYVKVFDFSKEDLNAVPILNLKHIDEINKNKTANKIMFSSIGGQNEAIGMLKDYFVFPFKYPNRYKNLEVPNSALLMGASGTGKKLGVKALANEMNVPLYSINASMDGESPEKIRNYYNDLRKNQPCILFFDKVETILKEREGLAPHTAKSVSVHLDEINKLKKEGAQVYMLAGTSHPELIDAEVINSSLFQTNIFFSYPDEKGCKEIFKIHTKGLKFTDFNKEAFIEALSEMQVNGADIAKISKIAQTCNMRRTGMTKAMEKGTFIEDNSKLVLSGEDFEAALDKFQEERGVLAYYINANINAKNALNNIDNSVNLSSNEQISSGIDNKMIKTIGFKIPTN